MGYSCLLLGSVCVFIHLLQVNCVDIFVTSLGVANLLLYLYLFFLQSFITQWLSSHCLLFLWQRCSLAPSPAALLRMCTVSHPLPPHAHPALTIQPTAPHSLSMHKKLNCILPLTPLWCSCQVTMFLM